MLITVSAGGVRIWVLMRSDGLSVVVIVAVVSTVDAGIVEVIRSVEIKVIPSRLVVRRSVEMMVLAGKIEVNVVV